MLLINRGARHLTWVLLVGTLRSYKYSTIISGTVPSFTSCYQGTTRGAVIKLYGKGSRFLYNVGACMFVRYLFIRAASSKFSSIDDNNFTFNLVPLSVNRSSNRFIVYTIWEPVFVKTLPKEQLFPYCFFRSLSSLFFTS